MEVKHRGEPCHLNKTRVEDLEVGQLVIGPCGHERTVSMVDVDHDSSTVKVSFKNTAKSWTKKSDDLVFVVSRP